MSEAGRRRARIGFVLVAVACAAAAIAAQWDEVRDRLGDLSAVHVGIATVCALGSLVTSFLAWRETLAGLDSRVPVRPAARIFYLGQLAKYVPGSIWAIVGQAELARAIGIRRERTATAGLVVLAVSLAMGLALSLLAVPTLVDADAAGYLWLLVLLAPLAVVLHPRVLTRLIGSGLALLRRPPLDRPLTARMVWRVCVLSVLSNALLGLQIWQLAVDLGGSGWELVPLAIGGYGIAAAVSLVVVPLPAGAGLREAVLVLVLAPRIGTAEATLVAIIARLILTAADISVAGLAALATRRVRPSVG